MKKLLLAFAAVLVGSCAYTQTNLLPIHENRSAIQQDQTGICIMQPDDGAYESDIYLGSGREVGYHIQHAIRSQFPDSLVLTEASETAARQKCLESGMQYLIVPVITHWEDRATQWSGMRDLIQIDVTVLQLNPPKQLNAGTFEARNSWFTFVNNPPEDLLDDDFDSFVRGLVGGDH